MKTRMIYIAFDETSFDSVEACRAYEAQHVETRLVGLTLEQVRAAVMREDSELAAVIEGLGERIRKARLSAGDLKRGKRAAPEPDAGNADRDAEPTATPAETPPDAAAKMAEAIRRTKAEGRRAWDERRGAVVPEAYAGIPVLRDAWLDGWREGQDERGRAAHDTAA